VLKRSDSSSTLSRTSGSLATALACLSMGLGSACSQEASPGGDFTGEQLAQWPTDSWPTNGGNLFNQRYSPLTEINRDNVSQLQGVWRTRLGGSGVEQKYSGEAQPIVHDGVAYIVTGADDVFAISVETGDILWIYEANLDQSIDVICCGWTSRGVGLSTRDRAHRGVNVLGRSLVRSCTGRGGERYHSEQSDEVEQSAMRHDPPLYVTGSAGRSHRTQTLRPHEARTLAWPAGPPAGAASVTRRCFPCCTSFEWMSRTATSTSS